MNIRRITGYLHSADILIIGFALYQAWTMNRLAVLVFTGPFQVGAAPPA